MAEAATMLTAAPTLAFVPLFGAGIMLVTVYTSYATFARYLKWMTAVLFAYVVAAVLPHPDWWEACAATVEPSLRWDAAYLATLVGVLGTTISPSLFFWQASQEVEEEKAKGRTTVKEREGATVHELSDAQADVGIGMLFSNLVMYFIILTTASTLYRSGLHDIETS